MQKLEKQIKTNKLNAHKLTLEPDGGILCCAFFFALSRTCNNFFENVEIAISNLRDCKAPNPSKQLTLASGMKHSKGKLMAAIIFEN
jgi:hypothetical protein